MYSLLWWFRDLPITVEVLLLWRTILTSTATVTWCLAWMDGEWLENTSQVKPLVVHPWCRCNSNNGMTRSVLDWYSPKTGAVATT